MSAEIGVAQTFRDTLIRIGIGEAQVSVALLDHEEEPTTGKIVEVGSDYVSVRETIEGRGAVSTSQIIHIIPFAAIATVML